MFYKPKQIEDLQERKYKYTKIYISYKRKLFPE